MIREFNHIVAKLSSLYGEQEARAIAYVLFADLLKIRKTEIFTSATDSLSAAEQQKLMEALNDLLAHIPVQHIVGFAHFMELKFNVNKHVLIPRPETEELVHLLLNDFQDKKVNILDIGTGSACIAISLKKNLPNATVYALDISENALELATENAKANHVEVNFKQLDILNHEEWRKYDDQKFDVIISNPPYVTLADKLQMQKNVLEHEPEMALFVPEDNPLLFYKAIAEFSKDYLALEGKIYLEINESLGKETKALFENTDFQHVQIVKDMQGKERMLVCKR